MTHDLTHPDRPVTDWGPFTKGEKIVYVSGSGLQYSARVLTRHRNGEITVKVMFPLDNTGREHEYGFVGNRYRIGAKNIGGRWGLK